MNVQRQRVAIGWRLGQDRSARLGPSRSPSPRPSPPGRGSQPFRRLTHPSPSDRSERGNRFSLSPRERTGVRGTETSEDPRHRSRGRFPGRFPQLAWMQLGGGERFLPPHPNPLPRGEGERGHPFGSVERRRLRSSALILWRPMHSSKHRLSGRRVRERLVFSWSGRWGCRSGGLKGEFIPVARVENAAARDRELIR